LPKHRPRDARRTSVAAAARVPATLPTSIYLSLDEADDPGALRSAVARSLGTSAEQVPNIEVLRRSIDARRGRVRFRLVVGLKSEPTPELALPHPRDVEPGRRVTIVGDGPAGLFCAYELARNGITSIVVERGKKVQPRRRDLRGLNQDGLV
jgi:NADPH-dependent 2,4-dienoyl-CoA reductase/sulfur reductase-like enzyme